MTLAIILIAIGLVLLVVDGIVKRQPVRIFFALCLIALTVTFIFPRMLNVNYRELIGMIFGK